MVETVKEMAKEKEGPQICDWSRKKKGTSEKGGSPMRTRQKGRKIVGVVKDRLAQKDRSTVEDLKGASTVEIVAGGDQQ